MKKKIAKIIYIATWSGFLLVILAMILFMCAILWCASDHWWGFFILPAAVGSIVATIFGYEWAKENK